MSLEPRASAAKASTTEAAATATSATSATKATRTARTTATRTAHIGHAAEEIYSIDNVQHGIAGDSVILRITALRGIEDAADRGLLMQEVIELQRERQRITLEERL